MIAKVFVSTDLTIRVQHLEKVLQEFELKQDHPDVLYIQAEEKLGVEQARRIKEHFLLKPYQAKGRGVVVEDLSNITPDAQNALLKVIEEPPEEAILLFGTTSTHHLLPTFLSRCQIIEFGNTTDHITTFPDIEKLLTQDTAERFKLVEKTDDKDALLSQLLRYVEQELIKKPEYVHFAKIVLEMERFQKAHVNVRGILEYLMLILPQK